MNGKVSSNRLVWPIAFLLHQCALAGQEPPSITQVAPGEWQLSWFGVAGRVYFFERSSNLLDWTYESEVVIGGHFPTSRTFSSVEAKHFWRLAYTDDFVSSNDVDGDGLTNVQEVSIALGSDPFSPDTNQDGLWDGVAHEAGLPVIGEDADGLSSSLEAGTGTLSWLEDTDGDGVADGLDPYPLDAALTTLPPPSGNSLQVDVFLDCPAGAVEL